MIAWNRSLTVQVGPAGGKARSWSGLSCEFKVVKTLKKEPNKAEIRLFNLTPDSTAYCTGKGLTARIIAGYEGREKQIFIGGIDKATPGREGVDTFIDIIADDGGHKYRSARVNRTFKGSTTTRQVIDALASDLGLPGGFIDDFPDMKLGEGLTLYGPARDQLDRLAEMLGADWYIQDEALYLLKRDNTQAEGPLITPETGLIGSPVAIEEKGKPSKLEVTTLLLPELMPGQRIQLKSRQYQGIFKVEELEHQGQFNTGSTWYTTAKVREVR